MFRARTACLHRWCSLHVACRARQDCRSSYTLLRRTMRSWNKKKLYMRSGSLTLEVQQAMEALPSANAACLHEVKHYYIQSLTRAAATQPTVCSAAIRIALKTSLATGLHITKQQTGLMIC